MSIISTNEEYKLKCRTLIAVLSVISLICTVISCSRRFLGYDIIENGISFWESTFKLTTNFPSLKDTFYMLLEIIPILLFLFYILKLHSNTKISIVVSVIFGIRFFYEARSLISTIYYYIVTLPQETNGATYTLPIEVCVEKCFYIVLFSLASIIVLTNFKRKKVLVSIASIVIVLSGLGELNGFVRTSIDYYLRTKQYLYLVTNPAYFIAEITLGLALFIFALKNDIPAVIKKSVSKNIADTAVTLTEQELKGLNDRRNAGLITEEEYTAQRAEIISRL